MSKVVFTSDRKFQLWSYIVSHKQLLLRSPKNEQSITRVDIVFRGVDFMFIKTSVNGLRVSIVDPSSIDALWLKPGSMEAKNLYHIETEGTSSYISAVECVSFEDDKEYYDESALVSSDHL